MSSEKDDDPQAKFDSCQNVFRRKLYIGLVNHKLTSG